MQVDLLQTRLKDLEENYIEKTVKLRLEGRIRELENKLELETTSKHRIEVSCTIIVAIFHIFQNSFEVPIRNFVYLLAF